MRRLALALLALSAARPLGAVELWSSGTTRLRIGGEVSGTLGPHDLGYFNDTEYGQNLLRQAWLSLDVELAAGERVALLAEARTENLERPRVYALYVRVRPWAGRPLDLQAGMVPPVFGRYARAYGADNPLIGDPLAYQYLTTMRTNTAPPGAEQLLLMKGNGWLVGYGTDWSYESGLPLVAGRRWDTGVQARLGNGPLQVSAAVTQGTLSRPRVEDDNGGKQVSARVLWRPVADLALGVSGARGEYLDRDVQAALPAPARGRTFRQRAASADAELARGHWAVRAEALWSGWDAAALTEPLLGDTLTARALTIEGRYTIGPGIQAGLRLDRLDFGDVQGPDGPDSWEAPVRRVEVGLAFAVTRQVRLKAAYQRNRREGGFVRKNDLVAVQGAFWF